jgi:hypothetical protein
MKQFRFSIFDFRLDGAGILVCLFRWGRHSCLPAIVLLIALMSGAGCSSNPAEVQAPPPPAPKLPAKSRQPDYWLEKPAVASVSAADYDKLWEACGQAARDRLFVLDRYNYREGVLTTQPMVSRQFFELWRSDALTFDDTMQSSLQTIRRTIHWTIEKSNGGYTATPKVVVERFSEAGRRITSPTQYRVAFAYQSVSGSPERDQGRELPDRYWYAIGRDQTLETALADSVRDKLK